MTANAAALSTWYTDGLRWIGSLVAAAADALERREAVVCVTHDEHRQRRAVEEYLDDLRFRMHSGH